ncbi:hypothetical protein D9M68_674820 [compost metagenome]
MQFVVGIEAGVQRKEFVEHRGEQEQVAFAEIALRVHAQFAADAAYRQAAQQAIDRLVTDLLQPAEPALAGLGRLRVVIARQVVGLEDGLERLDVVQRQVVQRHVADQLPEKIATQRRGVAGRHRADIAEREKLRGAFAGLADIAQRQPLRQVLVGAGQLDGQGFLRLVAARGEAQVGLQAVVEQRRLLVHGVVGRPVGRVADIVGERFERHVLPVALATGLPAAHPVHRIHPAVLRRMLGR